MLPLSQQRDIWLTVVPELSALLALMPELEGKLSVVHTGAGGGFILAVMLADPKAEKPTWWWHESVFLPAPGADLLERLALGQQLIDRAISSATKIVPTRKRRQRDEPNVIPFADYKQPPSEE